MILINVIMIKDIFGLQLCWTGVLSITIINLIYDINYVKESVHVSSRKQLTICKPGVCR